MLKNNSFIKITFSFIILCLPFVLKAQSSIYASNLRCEYLLNPMGIDEPLPRLSWTLTAVHPDNFRQQQTAYHIIVTKCETGLAASQFKVWDSGWVKSGLMQQITYNGVPLESDQLYQWKVCVRDEAGKQSGWSKTAYWTTGLFKPSEWTAKWIGTGDTQDTNKPECSIADPWLRKTFFLDNHPSKAVIFIASIGYHEVYINGNKIGNDVLSPCVSDYLKRARYVAYNITHELKPGKNVIALWLGTSWSIFSSYATDDKPRAPIVIAQVDIYGAQKTGKDEPLRIQTDGSWKTHPSPNQLLGKWQTGHMGGELWDATKEQPDWNSLTYDETDWKQAVVYEPRLMLTAQMVEANRLFREIKPISIEHQRDGSYRIDMGVNFAGWTEIKLKATPGQRVDMNFSERANEEMTFGIHNAFIMGKQGEGTFRNRFNYSSGRWITIRGLKEKPQLQDIRGWVVHTDYSSAATFICSDSLQNWIYNTVRWNFENLSIGGYVVDCPQRERLGYGGDAHATSETGLFNYQLGAFYTKWMQDWRDVQGARDMDPSNYGGNADYGILPYSAPTYQGGGGPGWGGITVVLPWSVYQQEGDTRILENNFDLIKNWLAFLDTHTENHLLVHFGGTWDFLGDWLWPKAGAEGMNNDKPENICFNNCYRVYNLRIAAKIAQIIGKQEYALKWEQEASRSSFAIQAKYYNQADHSYADGSMANLAAALLAEVPPLELRDTIMNRLAKEILVIRKGHIHVGITAGAMLFKLLRSEGRNDLIYAMTSQTDYPGWGYMKANGATSLWEMWEKDLPGHSLLHSSFLYPGAWYIDGVGGIIRDATAPGFQKFIIKPPKLNENQISWANTTYESPAGGIKTAWQRKKGILTLEVTVPPGCSATVYFPSDSTSQIKVIPVWAKKVREENDCAVFEVSAGKYTLIGKDYK